MSRQSVTAGLKSCVAGGGQAPPHFLRSAHAVHAIFEDFRVLGGLNTKKIAGLAGASGPGRAKPVRGQCELANLCEIRSQF